MQVPHGEPVASDDRWSARSSELSAAVSQVGWVPRRELAMAEWSAVGRRLGEIGRCSQWWLGDWILYGNLRFGERYSRAAKLTGYDAQSLMNMVYVASHFEIYRRREKLSWSHHASLASLDRDGQEHWLDRAIAEHMSVADLRVELRGTRRALKAVGSHPPPAEPDPAPGDHHAHSESASLAEKSSAERSSALVCPTCGGTVPVSH
jgi:hypothetical protein